MKKEEVSCTGLAFIAGVTVGAGVALLFAPQTGSEFRSSVRAYTRRAKDEWDHASEQGVDALDTVVQRGKEWIQRVLPKEAAGEARDMQSTEAAIGSAQSGGTAGDTGQDK